MLSSVSFESFAVFVFVVFVIYNVFVFLHFSRLIKKVSEPSGVSQPSSPVEPEDSGSDSPVGFDEDDEPPSDGDGSLPVEPSAPLADAGTELASSPDIVSNTDGGSSSRRSSEPSSVIASETSPVASSDVSPEISSEVVPEYDDLPEYSGDFDDPGFENEIPVFSDESAIDEAFFSQQCPDGFVDEGQGDVDFIPSAELPGSVDINFVKSSLSVVPVEEKDMTDAERDALQLSELAKNDPGLDSFLSKDISEGLKSLNSYDDQF